MTANYAVPLPGADLSALVTDALTDCGYLLSEPAPDAVRVSWHRRARAGLAQDVALVDVTGGWDLDLAAALSRRTGGYAIAWEPAAERTAVVYAGYALAVRDGTAAQEVSRYLEQVGVWTLFGLKLAAGSDAGSVLAVPPPGAAHGLGPAPAPARIVQIGLACDEQGLRDAPVPDGWRVLSGHTPEAGIPYVLLRGAPPLDPARLTALAVRTGGYAAAVELAGPGDAVPWHWATPDGEITTGIARTGGEVIEVWRDLATVLGTYPATFRWPVTG